MERLLWVETSRTLDAYPQPEAALSIPGPLRPFTAKESDKDKRVFAVSIKGVFFTSSGEVVLLMNERDEWALTGGRIETGESPEECVEREIKEESSVSLTATELFDTYLFELFQAGTSSS